MNSERERETKSVVKKNSEPDKQPQQMKNKVEEEQRKERIKEVPTKQKINENSRETNSVPVSSSVINK